MTSGLDCRECGGFINLERLIRPGSLCHACEERERSERDDDRPSLAPLARLATGGSSETAARVTVGRPRGRGAGAAESVCGEAQGVRTAKTPVDTTLPATDALTAIYGAMREAELQRSIRTYLKQHGFTVWVFPIMKRTIAGVPDLTFWHPSRPGLLWYWELKRERGRVRPEQVAAIAHLATVPGIDARIVRPSDWPALRDELEHVPPSEQEV